MIKKFALSSFAMISIILIHSCKKSNGLKEQQNNRPNIIFILADDLGAKDLSYTGSNFYETPNIDAIANEGTIFTNGYAACQVCSPSRASILLGQYPTTHGITDWIGAETGKKWGNSQNTKLLPPDYNYAISDDNITIAKAFKTAGYSTFFAGKWHLGAEPYSPEKYGFDVNIGGWEVGNPKGGYYAPWDNPKLNYKKEGESLTLRLAEETANYIEQNKDKPFFAFLSFYAVHTPLQTTQEKWKKYRDKAVANGITENTFKEEKLLPVMTTQDHPIYGGLVETMDDAVGIITRKLKELNLDQNTIVVFTSDNGGLVSSRYGGYATSNLPFRAGKGYQYEGGIREPYLIKAPMLNVKKAVDIPVSGIDFYPTLLSLANIEIPKNQVVDGKDLSSILIGETMDSRPLFWHYPHYGNQGGEPVSIIRENDWKLIYYWEDNHTELYNLKYDVSETTNVLADNQLKAIDLEQKLMNFLKETDAKKPTINPNYDEAKAMATIKQRKENQFKNLEKRRRELLKANYNPNNNWFDSGLLTED